MSHGESLASIQASAAILAERVVRGERWLLSEFLSDPTFNPTAYLQFAEEHKVLKRALFGLTERLLRDGPCPIIA